MSFNSIANNTPWWRLEDRLRITIGAAPRHPWGRAVSQLEIDYPHPVQAGWMKDRGRYPHHLTIRPCLGGDHRRLETVRWPDRQWLEPWESTLPPSAEQNLPTINQFRRISDWQSVRGLALPMIIEIDTQPVGLVSVANVQRGALHSATLGYWVTSKWAGCGIGSLAVATVIDLLLGELNLHRVEVNIRPENKPSIALAEKIGLTEEGWRPRYMNIAGKWCDHRAYSMDQEALPEGGLVTHHWAGAK